MRRDDPYATAAYASHIALELGQLPEEDAPDEWATPEGVQGTTKSVTSIEDGETLDPPAVQVHVYAGMEFYDKQADRTVTFRTARWFAFRSNPDLDHSRPMDPVEVQFEEDESPYEEESPRLELSGNEFAARIASGRYRNVTGEEDELLTDGGSPVEERGGRMPKSLRDLDYQNVTGADARPSIIGRSERFRGGRLVLWVGEDEENAEPVAFDLDYEQVHGLAEVFQKMATDIEVDEEENHGK